LKGNLHVRTNVVIDDRLLAQAQRLTGLSTTREVLEEGLKLLVRLKRQEKVKAWRGKLRWDGDLEAMRTDSGQ
jgi:Arc/MetJ family transcription regulator